MTLSRPLLSTFLLVLLLLNTTQLSHAFQYKHYCGTFSRLGKEVNIHVEVHDYSKIHIRATGSVEIDKDFDIYKRQGARIFVPICSGTGQLCNEDYYLYDYETHINFIINWPIYYGGELNANLVKCDP
eukprot:TRINITY_DN8632_c0_g1_i1.p1 TRINITY_DN8632_c0_g1~~TRINITY_DN8632_c0_g1_i1.p1  ORF type:complete len:128 (-),score=10.50 TRINITY_DN8632_c0_g1_i1:86-469(-)